MTRRDSARNESFARSFTPHDPSGNQSSSVPHYHTQKARAALRFRQDLHAWSSARPPHRVNYRSDIIDGGQSMGLRKPKNIKHNGKSLAGILEAHERFFSGKDGGVRADLTGADLSHADLTGVNLTGAILRNASLEGSDLRKAKLPGADLSNANLRKADLRNTDMTEAILPGADLTEAQASGVEFFRCDLSNVSFERARLRNVNLRLANVNGARFSGADMGVAILRETDLTGADLSGVDLSTARRCASASWKCSMDSSKNWAARARCRCSVPPRNSTAIWGSAASSAWNYLHGWKQHSTYACRTASLRKPTHRTTWREQSLRRLGRMSRMWK